MLSVENLLLEAQSLTPLERRRLAELLFEQAALEARIDEAGVGERGLLAWTESVSKEDWSAYYPEGFRPDGSRKQ